MEPATIASLINLGGAGAVIIVVVLFLKYLQKRDEEWRAFFVEISRGTATETQRLVASMDKLAEKLDDHDRATEPRINGAVNRAVETILDGTTPRRRATDKRS